MMSKQLCWSPRQLVLGLLLAGGSFALAKPLLAQTVPTAPGTVLRNVFTGTYDGAAAPVTSNEVTLEIAEIAGVTVTAQTPSDPGPDPGDALTVEFDLCNVGNDPTRIFIPGVARLVGPNAASFTLGTPLQVIAVGGTGCGKGTDLPTPIAVPATGSNSGTLAGLPNAGSLLPGQSIRVRVPVTAKVTAQKGDKVTVVLGDAPLPTGQTTQSVQNVASAAPGTTDVYTIDNTGTANGDSATDPLNGTREAMDGQDLVVGATFQAFATVLLAQTYNNAQTPGVITDDRFEYCLAGRVDDKLPAGLPTEVSLLPSDLNPTEITLDGAAVNRVLIADVLPAGLEVSQAPSGITGWTAVYTTNATTIRADKAQWQSWTTAPASLGSVTRVGFVSENALKKGTTTDCLTVKAQPRSTFTGGLVATIAQIFGQSQPGTVTGGTPTQLVYDESGDQTPNNGLVLLNPDPLGGTAAAAGGITDGVADVVIDGRDPGPGTDARSADTNQGNNGPAEPSKGTKEIGGETIVKNLVPSPVNGPSGQPAAIGPGSDNDDFTDKQIPPPAQDPALPLTDAQTPPVNFKNTVNNPTNVPQVISLLPTPPVATSGTSPLPNNTQVMITNPVTGQSATYVFGPGGFTFVSGTPGSSGITPSTTQPVTMEVSGNGTATYDVKIDLPSAQPQRAYPVPITAFVDVGTPGLDPEDPANVTIDRIYTGFIKVIKEARILDTDGTTEVVAFTTDQTLLGPASEKDRFVEYRITYSNLAGAGGSNNVTLGATQFVLTEDGTAVTNNWFDLTDDPRASTAPTTGSAIATLGTVSVTANGSDIQVYTVTIPDLAPGQSGTLTFRRQIVKP
jgi:hypothetical protein